MNFTRFWNIMTTINSAFYKATRVNPTSNPEKVKKEKKPMDAKAISEFHHMLESEKRKVKK